MNNNTALDSRSNEERSVRAENSTLAEAPAKDLESQIVALFNTAREESFEDGMASGFSKGLEALIARYGETALTKLAELVLLESINPEIAGESLRVLGRLVHPASHRSRRRLLERALRCSSAMVRDGAILGLASMGDPHASACIRQAIDAEPIQELRQDMQQVLNDLEIAGPCPTS